MKLDRIDIVNFRSIKNLTVKLTPRCRVLVGINEAGKTSILRALAFLDPDRNTTQDDVREPLPNEELSNESYVRFVFELNLDERRECFEQVNNKVLGPTRDCPLIKYNNAEFELWTLCEGVREGVYYVDVRNNKRNGRYWKFPPDHVIVPGWFVPSPSCPANVSVSLEDKSAKPLNSFALVHQSSAEAVPKEHLMPATPEHVHSLVGKAVADYIGQNLPECIYWEYNEDHLIPARIALDAFAQKPNSCRPLKHAFQLAGVADVLASLNEAKTRSNGVRNLLDRVAKKATEHVRSVWPEYKGLSIDLRQNGDNLETSVNDVHNLYNFARRSDGFKRFISFLLMISAPTKTKTLSNVLILNDDPDAGLHPAGARHLRDELIRISERNYVVYSTHSTHMIDRENVSRHYIVSKKEEVTTVVEADGSNIVDEEVLYNSLGTSLFEVLKSKNLVFEGWKDKKLYRTALPKIPSHLATIKKPLAEVGLCHVEGVKDVRRVSLMLELANRGCWIVSDSDNIAHERKSLHTEGKFYGDWVCYAELVPSYAPVTAEDFIVAKVFESAVAELIKISSSSESNPFQLLGNTATLKQLDTYLVRMGFSSDQKKEFVAKLKNRLFDNLRQSHIRPEYYEFLNGLALRLSGKDVQETDLANKNP